MDDNNISLENEIDKERDSLLELLQNWLELPMVVLAFIWLALFIAEVVWGLSPLLEILGYVIWALFILEFMVGFTLASKKLKYLRQNFLKGIALVAPALRIFAVFRVLRLMRLTRAAGMVRGMRMLRVISSINRGMRALAASMGRRGFGYVLLLTIIVTLVGAAGMYAFERALEMEQGFENYGHALWWTAMIMTTLGSDYWPETASGRILCFFLSLYALGVFGYITAALATFFVGSDAGDEETDLASAKSIAALRNDISALREEILSKKQ
jgi:voltage-gated potassium channel